MNDGTILVAGATGNLGGRIAGALVERGASVKAIVRHGAVRDRLEWLQGLGVTIASVDWSRASQVTMACSGASCVVSALAGLRDVIVETQSVLLDAAIKAGVPRFIPSDYSIDFTKFPPERIAISIFAETSTSASTRLRFQPPRSSTVRLPISAEAFTPSLQNLVLSSFSAMNASHRHKAKTALCRPHKIQSIHMQGSTAILPTRRAFQCRLIASPLVPLVPPPRRFGPGSEFRPC